MKKMQWISILIMIVGCGGMGAHLFLGDGIAHPTWVLTMFAYIFAAGMIGNLIAALLRLEKEWKQRRKKDSSGSNMNVTADEKRLVELYRMADSEARSKAVKLLRGEDRGRFVS